MILAFFLNFIYWFFEALLSPLPVVTSLPSIGGYDLDASLSSAFGFVYRVADVFWPLEIIFNGLLFLLLYFSAKSLLRFFLGARVPGNI